MQLNISVAQRSTALFLSLLMTPMCYAENTAFEQCLVDTFKTASAEMTLGQLKETCQNQLNIEVKESPKEQPEFLDYSKHLNNLAYEPYVMTPFVMSPHRMNYLLPVSYSDNVNHEVYHDGIGKNEKLQSVEVKYQLSFRVPLLTESLFKEGDGIAFAFTIQSWWQIYATDISRPFRETNYQPEIFYYSPLDWRPFDGNTLMVVGLEHQSNGHTNELSRGWNRAYANFVFAKDNYAISLRPWWRIPEGDKVTTITEPGDDNPDIDKYMGHFELSGLYKFQNYKFFFQGRQNFSSHKGSVELGFTFPLINRMRGYVQYTNGYGESLIDYNHSQQTFGIGVALTDFFED